MAKAYFPLYTSDYLRDTRTLSTKAHGAYILLLLQLWDCDGEMQESAKVIQRVTGLSDGEYRTVWHKDLRPFFTLEKGIIRHKRVTEELERRAKTLQKRCKSAAKGGRKTQQNQRDLKANAKQAKPIGLASTLRVERPSLAGSIESSSFAASPPSPERGGGDTSDGEALFALRRWLQRKVDGLMTAHVLSAREVRELKDALRGGSEDCLSLAPQYQPPDSVVSALESIAVDWKHLPQLKAIEGGKS